jgi:hypothetical protein
MTERIFEAEEKKPNYYPENHAPMLVIGSHGTFRLDESPNGDRFTVLDHMTGKYFRIRRAACGLGCRCSVMVVKEVTRAGER